MRSLLFRFSLLFLFGTTTFELVSCSSSSSSEKLRSQSPPRPRRKGPFPFLLRKNNRRHQQQQDTKKESSEEMGQAMRIAKYDRATNERNAISALKMAGHNLNWYRLDDGVMGGQSETEHMVTDSGSLHFKGTINTNGGGFTSIRTSIPDELDLSSADGIKLRLQGDGKTYKLFMTDGSRGGPMSRTPSWQMDIPTTNDESMREVEIPFDKLLPSFGPRTPSDVSQYKFDMKEMKEIGVMLSLNLSDGSPNPKETFGEGIFPFSLHVESIDSMQN